MRILAATILILGLSACASTQKWSSSGGSREDGLVRLSYEYAEFHQPEMSDVEAQAIALNRCNTWGYKQVEPIAGQIRQCSNMEGGNCNLWTVTREYQCKGGEGAYASRLSR